MNSQPTYRINEYRTRWRYLHSAKGDLAVAEGHLEDIAEGLEDEQAVHNRLSIIGGRFDSYFVTLEQSDGMVIDQKRADLWLREHPAHE